MSPTELKLKTKAFQGKVSHLTGSACFSSRTVFDVVEHTDTGDLNMHFFEIFFRVVGQILTLLVEMIAWLIGELMLSVISEEYHFSRDKNPVFTNVVLWVLAGLFLGFVVWGARLTYGHPGSLNRFFVIVCGCTFLAGCIGLVIELIRLRNKPQPAIQGAPFQNSPRTKHKKRSRRR